MVFTKFNALDGQKFNASDGPKFNVLDGPNFFLNFCGRRRGGGLPPLPPSRRPKAEAPAAAAAAKIAKNSRNVREMFAKTKLLNRIYVDIFSETPLSSELTEENLPSSSRSTACGQKNGCEKLIK